MPKVMAARMPIGISSIDGNQPSSASMATPMPSPPI